ncbi:MAG TPA: metallophosphoesterase [Ktedonobacterales bacterium]|nr:metallophosphoesterase [Ktedonobacterales bacterium]
MTPNQLLRRGIAWASAAALAGIAYSSMIEPGWVDVTRVSLALPRLAPVFCGYRVIQLSDLHMGDWMNAARLNAVVRLANEHSPDLIAITGDFITRRAVSHMRDLACGLGRLKARDGVVAVLGNHDHWSDAQAVRDVLAASGICELANDFRTLHRAGAQLHVAGVDDIIAGCDRLDLLLARLPTDGVAILLAHEPDFADESAATGRFALQLSGHTHGGQIVAPLLGPLLLPAHGRKYPSGRYQVGGMIQYTNRGVGVVSPFVRINCRPEVTVFDLHAQSGCLCKPADK